MIFFSCCCKNGLNDFFFLFVYLCDFRLFFYHYFHFYFKFSLKIVVENIISLLQSRVFSTQLLSLVCILLLLLLFFIFLSFVFFVVVDFMCMIFNVQSPLKSVTCHLVVSVVHTACHRFPISCMPFACQYSNISTTK